MLENRILQVFALDEKKLISCSRACITQEIEIPNYKRNFQSLKAKLEDDGYAIWISTETVQDLPREITIGSNEKKDLTNEFNKFGLPYHPICSPLIHS